MSDTTDAGIETDGTSIDNLENVTDLTATETETPTDSSPETKPEATTPTATEDKTNSEPHNVPFHEDPKVQDYINRQVEKRISEMNPKAPAAEQPPVTQQPQIPSWFAGDRNDPATHAAWKEFADYLSGMTAKAKSDAIAELKSQQEQEQARIKEAQDWFKQSIAGIESTEKVQLSDSDRNKLMKFVYDNYIVDDKGRWNYSKAFQFMKAMEKASQADPKASIEARKKIAADSTSDSKPEPKQSGIVDAKTARSMSWDD